MVYQELSLVPGLTVAENILLGRTPKRRRLIDWAATYARAEEILARLGVAIDVRARTGDLGVAQQQIVEIAKAMSFDPAVLILDEPTSALASHETAQLFRVVKGLAAAGVAIIYISHRPTGIGLYRRPSHGLARRASHRHGGDAGDEHCGNRANDVRRGRAAGAAG